MPEGRRTAVILQPSYLPWLGYLAQMHRSDIFIVYDDVQFDKGSWRNRNRIKTLQGIQWLTVPVLTKSRNWPTNREVEINNSVSWRHKHLCTLKQNYAKAPYYADYIGIFEDLYARNWRFLFDLNMTSLEALTDALGLKRDIRLASEIGVEGKGVERLIGLCRAVGASHFFEGAAGRNYIEEAYFSNAAIRLEYQDYRHPIYPQLGGEFIPYLSVVDLIFNCGQRSLEILVQ